MSDRGPEPPEHPDGPPPEAVGTSTRLITGDRLRATLVWAGIATMVVLTVLALYHLASDLSAVLSIKGGKYVVVERLLPTAILALVGGLLVIVVAWLAGSGRRRELIAIGVGMVVLIAIRLFTAATMDGGTKGEPLAYGLIAETLLTPDWDLMGRPAGYPLLLAGAFSVIGDRQLAAEVVNLLLAVMVGGVVLALARGLYGPRVGALALLAYALWPAGAMMIVVRIPQTAFDLVVIATAWAALGTRPGWRGSALTGALLGLAQYLRPTAPILVPAYLVARMWPGDTWQRLLKSAVVPLVGIFFLALTPLMAYNLERTGSPSFSSSDYGGWTMYIGTTESSGGQYDREAVDLLIAQSGPTLIERSEKGAELALQRIKDDPIGIAALAVRKQDTLWGTEHYGVQYGIKQGLEKEPQARRATTPLLLSQGFYVLVLITALGAMVVRRHERDALIPLVTLVIWAAAATHALLEVRDRHHSYVIPLLLPLAAFAVAALYGRIERLMGRSAPE